MASAAEVLDSLKELRKENKQDHRDITERLDTMNGTQREHTAKIGALEFTQTTHEGKHGIADHERLSLKKRLDAVATTKTATAVIVGGAVTIVTLILEAIKALTAGG